MVTFVPFPNSLSNAIVPEFFLVNVLAIYNPKPVPWKPSVLLALKKVLNNLTWSSLGIPIPKSIISRTIVSLVEERLRITFADFSDYLKALFKILRIAYSISFLSALTVKVEPLKFVITIGRFRLFK